MVSATVRDIYIYIPESVSVYHFINYSRRFFWDICLSLASWSARFKFASCISRRVLTYALAKICRPMSELRKKENWKYSRQTFEGALSLKMSKHSRSRRHQCGRLINKHYQPRAHSLKTRICESHGRHRDKLPIFHACSSMSAAFVNTKNHAWDVLQRIWIVYSEKYHLQLIGVQAIYRQI